MTRKFPSNKLIPLLAELILGLVKLTFSFSFLKFIFSYENGCILINISLKYVQKGPIRNIPVMAYIIMGWRHTRIWPDDGIIR